MLIYEDMIKSKYLILVLDLEDTTIEVMVLNEIDNIAKLVAKSKSDLALYTEEFELVLSTFGCFLNKCDSEYREWIIEKLIEVQSEEVECDNIVKIKKGPYSEEDIKFIEEATGYKIEIV